MTPAQEELERLARQAASNPMQSYLHDATYLASVNPTAILELINYIEDLEYALCDASDRSI